MRRWLATLALGGLLLWAYAPALNGSWLWDDGLEVAQNSVVHGPGGWWKPWTGIGGMDYFPLKSSLQWAEWHLWGARTLPYHLINVLLQGLATLLLVRIFCRLGMEEIWAWVGGAWFALHPMAVESVAWIAEFKNEFSGVLLLAAILAWLRFDESRRPTAYWEAVAWFAAALLAKSTVVMLAPLLLLHAWWRRGKVGRKDLVAAFPFFALALAMGAVTVWFQRHRAEGLTGVLPGAAERWRAAGGNLVGYVVTTVGPHTVETIYPAPDFRLWLIPWIAVATVIGVAWCRRATWGRTALLAGGWWLLMLLPVLGFLPLSYLRVAPRADHLGYLALVGAAGGAAASLGLLGRRRASAEDAGGVLARPPGAIAAQSGSVAWASTWRIIALVVGGATVLAMAVEDRTLAASYRDETAFWSRAVQRNPSAWLAQANLGRCLLQNGQVPTAIERLKVAVRLQPDSAETQADLGSALDRAGNPAEARVHYQAAVTSDPRFAGGYYDLGLWYLRAGELKSAADEFRAAVRLRPGYAAAWNNLGLALYRLGQPAEARRAYELALQADPARAEIHLNLGNLLYRQDDLAGAEAQYRRSLQCDPGYEAAHRNLAALLMKLGRYRDAEAELHAARESSSHAP